MTIASGLSFAASPRGPQGGPIAKRCLLQAGRRLDGAIDPDHELAFRDGFHQPSDNAGTMRALFRWLGLRGGNDNGALTGTACAQRFDELQSVHAWHLKVD